MDGKTVEMDMEVKCVNVIVMVCLFVLVGLLLAVLLCCSFVVVLSFVCARK